MKLDDKVAIVTGSTRGIGKAVALRFAKEGARVVVNGVVNKENAEAVVAEIGRGGGEAMVVMADVSRRDEAQRLVAETMARFDRVDILVSNAGIVIDKPFMESTQEDWTRSLEINLHGFFNVSQAVLPHMIARK